MTEQRKILKASLEVALEVEIKRMCTTDDLMEFAIMYNHAKENLDKLAKVTYEMKIDERNKEKEL